MFPLETYWIVIFENGERWKFEGVKMIYSQALEQAAARLTKIKCFLYGYENSLGEFIPDQAFNAEGEPDETLLVFNLLEGGLNSRSLRTVAMASLFTKFLMKELKKEKGK